MFPCPQRSRSPCPGIQAGEYIRPEEMLAFQGNSHQLNANSSSSVPVPLLPRCCSLQYFCYSHNICFCLVGLKLAIATCDTEEASNCTEAFSSESNLNLHTAKITDATTLYRIYINTNNININFYNIYKILLALLHLAN